MITLPKAMIRPRTFLLKPEMSLFVGGLGRVDYLSLESNDTSIRLTVYASHHLPILICDLNEADKIYQAFLGTSVLGVPIGDADRLKKWPKMVSSDIISLTGNEKNETVCDFVMSSAGWIGVNLPKLLNANFRVWTPGGMGIVVRDPPLLPYGDKLKGNRIRNSLAYRNGKVFV